MDKGRENEELVCIGRAKPLIRESSRDKVLQPSRNIDKQPSIDQVHLPALQSRPQSDRESPASTDRQDPPRRLGGTRIVSGKLRREAMALKQEPSMERVLESEQTSRSETPDFNSLHVNVHSTGSELRMTGNPSRIRNVGSHLLQRVIRLQGELARKEQEIWELRAGTMPPSAQGIRQRSPFDQAGYGVNFSKIPQPLHTHWQKRPSLNYIGLVIDPDQYADENEISKKGLSSDLLNRASSSLKDLFGAEGLERHWVPAVLAPLVEVLGVETEKTAPQSTVYPDNLYHPEILVCPSCHHSGNMTSTEGSQSGERHSPAEAQEELAKLEDMVEVENFEKNEARIELDETRGQLEKEKSVVGELHSEEKLVTLGRLLVLEAEVAQLSQREPEAASGAPDGHVDVVRIDGLQSSPGLFRETIMEEDEDGHQSTRTTKSLQISMDDGHIISSQPYANEEHDQAGALDEVAEANSEPDLACDSAALDEALAGLDGPESPPTVVLEEEEDEDEEPWDAGIDLEAAMSARVDQISMDSRATFNPEDEPQRQQEGQEELLQEESDPAEYPHLSKQMSLASRSATPEGRRSDEALSITTEEVDQDEIVRILSSRSEDLEIPGSATEDEADEADEVFQGHEEKDEVKELYNIKDNLEERLGAWNPELSGPVYPEKVEDPVKEMERRQKEFNRVAGYVFELLEEDVELDTDARQLSLEERGQLRTRVIQRIVEHLHRLIRNDDPPAPQADAQDQRLGMYTRLKKMQTFDEGASGFNSDADRIVSAEIATDQINNNAQPVAEIAQNMTAHMQSHLNTAYAVSWTNALGLVFTWALAPKSYNVPPGAMLAPP
ncbi:unnamed protein product, partial [Mesorhabditis spiculigera]